MIEKAKAASKRTVWSDSSLFSATSHPTRSYSLPKKYITLNPDTLKKSDAFWLQLAISSTNGVESARWCSGSPNSNDMILMIQDIGLHGADCIISSDGAAYNKSAATTAASIKLTGEPFAIVPPYSPHLACPEACHRIIK
jgi:hypothetical protein